VRIFLWGAFIVLLAALVAGTGGYRLSDTQGARQVRSLENVTAVVEGRAYRTTLPHVFSGLPARTPVTVLLDISPTYGDCLYFKSVYAPLRVWANSTLLYEYGQDGTYPAYMSDPATAVDIVSLPETGSTVHLRLEFLSPTARSSLTIHPLLLGTQANLYRHLCETLGFPFIFSILLIISGIFLLLLALFVVFFERKGMAFHWLGLFSVFAGIWTFGECNLTGLLIRNPTLLYLLAFIGLFSIPVPLLLFGRTVVPFHQKKPLRWLTLLYAAATVAALALQLTGLVPFERSMYVFHILEPLTLCLLTGGILFEMLHYHSPAAKRFLIPTAVLALSAVLEELNYLFHFTYTLSLFFQSGILLFVLSCGVVGGILIRDAMHLKDEEQKLKYEMGLMEYRLEEEKKHQRLLLENQEAVRAQRHDLRHQLAVIRSFSERGDNVRMNEYLDSLVAAIPSEQGRSYCENAAVNAIVSHYAAKAEQAGVEMDIRLTVPERMEQISDSSLCVIVGNLLENAGEACARMTEGRRFIRLRSRLQYGTLTITMDNSFDGRARRQGEAFLSSKRDEVGTGLRSVRAMAEKYGGGASFETDGAVFLSSVYVRI
jgi:hypothetical protein